VGINPAGRARNPFSILAQYTDGLSLYEYSAGNPITAADPLGLSAVEKSKAIDALKAFDDEHSWYLYYFATGLSDTMSKLFDALNWVKPKNYIHDPSLPKDKWLYRPFWHKMYFNFDLPISGDTMFHEAIHAHNDKTTWWSPARWDEGIACTATYMAERVLPLLKRVEDYLSAGHTSKERYEQAWRSAWRNANEITDLPGWYSDNKTFPLFKSDAINVSSQLKFKLSCTDLAALYTAWADWLGIRCVWFTCKTKTKCPDVEITIWEPIEWSVWK